MGKIIFFKKFDGLRRVGPLLAHQQGRGPGCIFAPHFQKLGGAGGWANGRADWPTLTSLQGNTLIYTRKINICSLFTYFQFYCDLNLLKIKNSLTGYSKYKLDLKETIFFKKKLFLDFFGRRMFKYMWWLNKHGELQVEEEIVS